MKTGNRSAKKFKAGESNKYSSIGGSTPPQSRVQLLPRNMNKPFIKRFMEWWS